MFLNSWMQELERTPGFMKISFSSLQRHQLGTTRRSCHGRRTMSPTSCKQDLGSGPTYQRNNKTREHRKTARVRPNHARTDIQRNHGTSTSSTNGGVRTLHPSPSRDSRTERDSQNEDCLRLFIKSQCPEPLP